MVGDVDVIVFQEKPAKNLAPLQSVTAETAQTLLPRNSYSTSCKIFICLFIYSLIRSFIIYLFIYSF